MKMKFSKMHGAGNDYIYVNGFEHEPLEDPHKIAVKVSDRHFGIGGDGLVLIEPSYIADARMRMFNADGSEAEMCGNAIRCVAKYVYEHGINKEDTLKIETGAGVLTLKLNINEGSVESVRVNMGKPILNGTDIPTTFNLDKVLKQKVEIDGQTYEFSAVSMGNPHAVVYVDSVDDFPVERVGRQIETHNYFPNRVNVEFIEIVNSSKLKQRTWERGSGETLACGTGASAACVASVLNGVSDNKVDIELLGGILTIEWAGEGSDVYMTGPATQVFDGTIDI